MCISMITHPRAEADTLEILRRWVAASAVPVSILSNPTTMGRGDVRALAEAGADIFTVALDAATPALFAEHRGKGRQSPHSWAKYWEVFGYAREIFGPGRVGMHVILGLGETDRDVLGICRDLHAVGGHSHLFCFFPERGSLLAHMPAPPRARWRRVQLARYLIEYAGVEFAALRFDEAGGLVDFGVPAGELEAIVATGVPFRTSGCPGSVRPDVSACNRPYGDSPPSDIASFPYAPEEDDMAVIRKQLA
jgi:biotin synthase